MSAIAYVTDSKMLELHRLNSHKTMNFRRLSNNINFSDFTEGDLVFFLSKDKEHRQKNEKGIVGFGRLVRFNIASVKKMWDTYGILNGYRTSDEFKEAIIRVSKDKKLPAKISSFYLENVTFFQPVYLSECGMKISNNIESYIYLKDEETVMKLLKIAHRSGDLWSDIGGNSEAIEKEEILYALFSAHDKIGDINVSDKIYRRSHREIKKYGIEHPEYVYVRDSNNELYKLENRKLDIVLYADKAIDQRMLAGQAAMYRQLIRKYCYSDVKIYFHTTDSNGELEEMMNGGI